MCRLDRKQRLNSVLVFSVAWTLAGTLTAASWPFAKGPYVQAPGPDTMTIMWESPSDSPGIVRFGRGGRLDQAVITKAPARVKGVATLYKTNYLSATRTNVTTSLRTNFFHIHTATLRGLEPATVYSYAVEQNRVQSPPRRFKTFGWNPDTVTFIAYGDTRTRPQVHAAVARHFKAFSPDFILHTGDLVARGKDYGLWAKEFFGPLANVMDEVPLLPVIGNHEDDGANYLAFFHLPHPERWYAVDVGPVHILALDYHSERASSEQFRFASLDLKTARAPWKIVMLHYPVFNVGGHATGWGHEHYLPLFHETKVDLVLTGHSHLYERFRPIASQADAGQWAITHIVTGGGGAPIAASYDHPALAARASTNHFLVFEATHDTLSGRAITVTGEVLDSFTFRKSNGQLSADYLAQAYSEEWLRVSFDAARSLAGRMAALPKTTAPAYVMFTVRPMKSTRQPVELEIGPSPDSALYYELDGGPLRVTTPAPGRPDRVVWGRLRATGRKSITEGKNRELSPELTFQAKVTMDWGETFAYGAKCRLSNTAATEAKKLSLR